MALFSKKLFFFNGKIRYEGDMKDGAENGFGTSYYYENGGVEYRGNWVNGNRDGQGTLYYQSEKKTDPKCMRAALKTESFMEMEQISGLMARKNIKAALPTGFTMVKELFMIGFSIEFTPANGLRANLSI
jgi:antitoxin component YwqK of YwqJK toxin-antitoxin module